jgi:hypothetical protein
MLFRIAADLVVVGHLSFILFVVLGGFFVLRWRILAWFHIPAAIWGALIEFGGWICPLTPLENLLRRTSGAAGYGGGFVDHYLIPIIYPVVLNRTIQISMGVVVIVLNGVIYAFILGRCLKKRKKEAL